MLITRIDIALYREIARGVREDKINPYIDDAEALDLKPLLGNSLFYDLVKNAATQKYIDLLDAKEFDVNGVTYKHVGLKKILAIFSDARYKLFGSMTDTSFALVEKNYEGSTPVSHTSKSSYYKLNQQIATQYFADVALFLDNNKDIYTLWKQGCETRPMGTFRISKIS